MKKNVLLSLIFLLAACSHGVDGTYLTEDGQLSLTFTDTGKVIVKKLVKGESAPIQEVELSYNESENKVKFLTVDGLPIVLTVLSDGSLEGAPFNKLVKTN